MKANDVNLTATLEKAFNGQETYVLTDEAKKHCAKKGGYG